MSDGESELPAGDDEPFLMDDLSEATVDSDDEEDEDAGHSTVPHDPRRPACLFCPGEIGAASDPQEPSTAGVLAIAVSSSRAPLSTSSQPSKSVFGAVDGASWAAGRGGVGPVVQLAGEGSAATESKS